MVAVIAVGPIAGCAGVCEGAKLDVVGFVVEVDTGDCVGVNVHALKLGQQFGGQVVCEKRTVKQRDVDRQHEIRTKQFVSVGALSCR